MVLIVTSGLPIPSSGCSSRRSLCLLRSYEDAVGADGARRLGRREETRAQSIGRGGRQLLPYAEKLAQVLPIALPPGRFVEGDGGDGANLEGVGGGDAEVATSTPA